MSDRLAPPDAVIASWVHNRRECSRPNADRWQQGLGNPATAGSPAVDGSGRRADLEVRHAPQAYHGPGTLDARTGDGHVRGVE